MNEEIREAIALFRYKCISPVLAEPGRVQNEYFRQLAAKEHNVPCYGIRKYAVSTFKGWLKFYLADGFETLKPAVRADLGHSRAISKEQIAFLRQRWEQSDNMTAKFLYYQLLEEGQLGDPPISYNTILRILHREKLLPRDRRKDKRKSFETAAFGELWLSDFMHGPMVKVGNKKKKAILCAIIDDHTRLIVGYAFSAHETISDLTMVLKDAISAYGLPKRLYVDNGPAFSCDLLAKACAKGKVSLIHSKPYDSPSRGKIERWFRTVRDSFLPHLRSTPTLDELNLSLHAWLNDKYHHRVHSTTKQKPIDRYYASVGRVSLPRVSQKELDLLFLVHHHRIVNNDSTISFKGKIYEVPPAYIRQKIEIRHPVDDPDDLTLYDRGNHICKIKLVDKKENARTFCPKNEPEAISFSDEKVNS
jgi:putative transposase